MKPEAFDVELAVVLEHLDAMIEAEADPKLAALVAEYKQLAAKIGLAPARASAADRARYKAVAAELRRLDPETYRKLSEAAAAPVQPAPAAPAPAAPKVDPSVPAVVATWAEKAGIKVPEAMRRYKKAGEVVSEQFPKIERKSDQWYKLVVGVFKGMMGFKPAPAKPAPAPAGAAPAGDRPDSRDAATKAGAKKKDDDKNKGRVRVSVSVDGQKSESLRDQFARPVAGQVEESKQMSGTVFQVLDLLSQTDGFVEAAQIQEALQLPRLADAMAALTRMTTEGLLRFEKGRGYALPLGQSLDQLIARAGPVAEGLGDSLSRRAVVEASGKASRIADYIRDRTPDAGALAREFSLSSTTAAWILKKVGELDGDQDRIVREIRRAIMESLGEDEDEMFQKPDGTPVSVDEIIRVGDTVTITTPQKQQRTGKAVMRGPHGWVLNLGGAHGTPGIASDRNVFSIKRGKKVIYTMESVDERHRGRFEVGDPVQVEKHMQGGGTKGTVSELAPSGVFCGVKDRSGKFIGYYHESDLISLDDDDDTNNAAASKTVRVSGVEWRLNLDDGVVDVIADDGGDETGYTVKLGGSGLKVVDENGMRVALSKLPKAVQDAANDMLDSADESVAEGRIDVKVTADDGDTWVTGFNGTLAAAKRYFLGQSFNRGRSEDEMVKVVKVELVETIAEGKTLTAEQAIARLTADIAKFEKTSPKWAVDRGSKSMAAADLKDLQWVLRMLKIGNYEGAYDSMFKMDTAARDNISVPVHNAIMALAKAAGHADFAEALGEAKDVTTEKIPQRGSESMWLVKKHGIVLGYVTKITNSRSSQHPHKAYRYNKAQGVTAGGQHQPVDAADSTYLGATFDGGLKAAIAAVVNNTKLSEDDEEFTLLPSTAEGYERVIAEGGLPSSLLPIVFGVESLSEVRSIGSLGLVDDHEVCWISRDGMWIPEQASIDEVKKAVGVWRTTKSGKRIYIENGKITKGNPKLLASIKGRNDKRTKDHNDRRFKGTALAGGGSGGKSGGGGSGGGGGGDDDGGGKGKGGSGSDEPESPSEKHVLKAMKHGPISHSDLRAQTGLSYSELDGAVADLVKRGKLKRVKVPDPFNLKGGPDTHLSGYEVAEGATRYDDFDEFLAAADASNPHLPLTGVALSAHVGTFGDVNEAQKHTPEMAAARLRADAAKYARKNPPSKRQPDSEFDEMIASDVRKLNAVADLLAKGDVKAAYKAASRLDTIVRDAISDAVWDLMDGGDAPGHTVHDESIAEASTSPWRHVIRTFPNTPEKSEIVGYEADEEGGKRREVFRLKMEPKTYAAVVKQIDRRGGSNQQKAQRLFDYMQKTVGESVDESAPKKPAQMTASQINAELDRLDKESTSITDEMIAAGRGGETFSQTRKATDPLGTRRITNADRESELRMEIVSRYGSSISRLPIKRGSFGPRESLDEGFTSGKKKFGTHTVRVVRGVIWVDNETTKASYFVSIKHGEARLHHENAVSSNKGDTLDRLPPEVRAHVEELVAQIGESVDDGIGSNQREIPLGVGVRVRFTSQLASGPGGSATGTIIGSEDHLWQVENDAGDIELMEPMDLVPETQPPGGVTESEDDDSILGEWRKLDRMSLTALQGIARKLGVEKMSRKEDQLSVIMAERFGDDWEEKLADAGGYPDESIAESQSELKEFNYTGDAKWTRTIGKRCKDCAWGADQEVSLTETRCLLFKADVAKEGSCDAFEKYNPSLRVKAADRAKRKAEVRAKRNESVDEGRPSESALFDSPTIARSSITGIHTRYVNHDGTVWALHGGGKVTNHGPVEAFVQEIKDGKLRAKLVSESLEEAQDGDHVVFTDPKTGRDRGPRYTLRLADGKFTLHGSNGTVRRGKLTPEELGAMMVRGALRSDDMHTDLHGRVYTNEELRTGYEKFRSPAYDVSYEDWVARHFKVMQEGYALAPDEATPEVDFMAVARAVEPDEQLAEGLWDRFRANHAAPKKVGANAEAARKLAAARARQKAMRGESEEITEEGDVDGARKYVRSIKNDAKRTYALSYLAHLMGEGKKPEAPAGLSYMGAQAVRHTLDSFGFQSTDEAEKKETCAECGEHYPCSVARRTDVLALERAKHVVAGPKDSTEARNALKVVLRGRQMTGQMSPFDAVRVLLKNGYTVAALRARLKAEGWDADDIGELLGNGKPTKEGAEESVDEGYQHVHWKGSTSLRFKIARAKGMVTVQGRTFGGKIGVHVNNRTGDWTVTHIPTGLLVFTEKDDRIAVHVAKRLENLGDKLDFTSAADMPDDVKAAFRAAVASKPSAYKIPEKKPEAEQTDEEQLDEFDPILATVGLGTVVAGGAIGMAVVKAVRAIQAAYKTGKRTAAEQTWDHLSKNDQAALRALLKQHSPATEGDEQEPLDTTDEGGAPLHPETIAKDAKPKNKGSDGAIKDVQGSEKVETLTFTEAQVPAFLAWAERAGLPDGHELMREGQTYSIALPEKLAQAFALA